MRQHQQHNFKPTSNGKLGQFTNLFQCSENNNMLFLMFTIAFNKQIMIRKQKKSFVHFIKIPINKNLFLRLHGTNDLGTQPF